MSPLVRRAQGDAMDHTFPEWRRWLQNADHASTPAPGAPSGPWSTMAHSRWTKVH